MAFTRKDIEKPLIKNFKQEKYKSIELEDAINCIVDCKGKPDKVAKCMKDKGAKPAEIDAIINFVMPLLK